MSKKSKQKYYVVWNGRRPGIYEDWQSCQKQISGYKNAKFKSFKTLELAKQAFEDRSDAYIGKQEYESAVLTKQQVKEYGLPIEKSISVDAACSNNPGVLEYRAVKTTTKDEIFKKGPYQEGTINIGEFLAIVDGIRYLRKHRRNIPIYSDSEVAIKWVKDEKVNTQLEQTKINKQLFRFIEKALKYLKKTKYNNKIIKWPTAVWGEIPADFGRK